MTEEQAEQLSQVSVTEDDDVVDPWTVTGKSETGIDYDKLISECIPIIIILFSIWSKRTGWLPHGKLLPPAMQISSV